jgi:hypothetical protein
LNGPSGPNDNQVMERSDGRVGWFSYRNAPGGKDHLAPEVRARVEERHARRGPLLCEVVVSVYEHGCTPSVAFPPDAAFDVKTDSALVAGAVHRARDALASWR